MYKDKSILALIPARGGSKGLPRKNMRLLLGKPLIAWTIEQAKKSRYIDRIIVSTDDEEIREISKKYGAEAPFLRPKKLATDKAKVIDAILHLMEFTKKNGTLYDILALLQPTSPLRLSEDIDKAVELLLPKKAKAIVSVCRSKNSPLWANKLSDDGCMKGFIKPDVLNKNRQALPYFYRLNGAVHIGYLDYIKRQHDFFGNQTFAHIMPRERSVDIDDEFDFWIAEQILAKRLKENRL